MLKFGAKNDIFLVIQQHHPSKATRHPSKATTSRPRTLPGQPVATSDPPLLGAMPSSVAKAAGGVGDGGGGSGGRDDLVAGAGAIAARRRWRCWIHCRHAGQKRRPDRCAPASYPSAERCRRCKRVGCRRGCVRARCIRPGCSAKIWWRRVALDCRPPLHDHGEHKKTHIQQSTYRRRRVGAAGCLRGVMEVTP